MKKIIGIAYISIIMLYSFDTISHEEKALRRKKLGTAIEKIASEGAGQKIRDDIAHAIKNKNAQKRRHKLQPQYHHLETELWELQDEEAAKRLAQELEIDPTMPERKKRFLEWAIKESIMDEDTNQYYTLKCFNKIVRHIGLDSMTFYDHHPKLTQGGIIVSLALLFFQYKK